jgi:ADP-heptose:LPS heptosyltransferase
MRIWFTKGVRSSKYARNALSSLVKDNIKTIAVLRHGALGDMVLTRAFLVEARKTFPNAKITLSIVSNYTRGTPEDLVDRVHVVHGSDQRGTPILKRIKRIKELGYQDIIFDLAASNRSVMTCFFNKAGLKIGFPYRALQAKLFYDIAISRSDLNFEVNEMMNMLHVFGAKTAFPHRYQMTGEAVRRERPYLVYFIGASVPDKCWPHDHYSALLQELSVRYPDHDHLVLEGIQSWEKADAILAPFVGSSHVMAISTDTVEATTALLKGASLLISNDTGIRHIAIACETPTVGIFYADPFRYWPRYPIHDIVLPEPAWPPSMDKVKQACIALLDQTTAVKTD